MHVHSYNLAPQIQVTSFGVSGVYFWQVKLLYYQIVLQEMFGVALPSQVSIGE